MKKNLCNILLVVLSCFLANSSYAQMYAVPDPNFKTKLIALGYSSCFNTAMDSLNSNCINIQNTVELNLSNANISNLAGIQAFENLIFLNVSHNNLSNIPVLNSPDLMGLDATYNNLSSVGTLPDSLQILHLDYNPIVNLPVLSNSLVTLGLEHTNVAVLPNPLPPSLQALVIKNTAISTLPALPNSLGILRCDSTTIAVIPNMPGTMNHLSCRNTNISSIPDLPGGTSYLDVYNTNVSCLPLRLSLTQPNATQIICDTSIIHCKPMADYNIFSGSTNIFVPTFPYCGTGTYTQCPVGFNIVGAVFYDSTNLCTFDNSDGVIANAKVLLLDAAGNVLNYTFTNTQGQYMFNTTAYGTYTLRVDTAALAIGTSCAAYQSLSSIISAADSIDINMNFGLRCNGNTNDKISYGTAVNGVHFPGDTISVKALIGQLGLCNPNTGGIVKLIKSGSAQILGIAPTALTPAFINNDSVIWNVPDFNTIDFSTAFKVLARTNTNAGIGTQVCYQTQVSTTLPETSYSNNIFNSCYNVVNSHDPNDKNVQPKGNVSPDNQWLVYTIRFQNTGNAPARNINIKDTISTNVDINTLEVLDFSFKPVVEVSVPNRAVRFGFNAIHLPDSFSNEPMSHGYVTYRIKQSGNLAAGATIKNTAHIYFDYNSPITTNTAITTIEIPSRIKEVTRDQSLQVYPNPVAQQFILTIDGKRVSDGRVALYDVTGKQVFNQSLRATTAINIGHLPAGNYLLHYINQQGETLSFKIAKK
ncbi:hypothetical protein DBR32_01205 [Taibaiella sp. KBW10]|uniref:DUF7619 domain-containing protein n=1 Tax=Taibaiella sp. KBW10 TaxID=2153357 RepID=UPI000F5B5DC7|nr:T9SS type A sorting domain-containing protein [Taibaiella sp. KBW10]RQO32256.1 hypothetical protein DBR32_01205 [Taibaiella sp. KBW10]